VLWTLRAEDRSVEEVTALLDQKRRPELRGQPVIVGGKGDPNSRAVVSAASYEARRHGVHSGMPLRQASRRCPKAVFLPVDFATYAIISKQVMGILQSFSTRLEPAGLDEAFLDVSYADRPAEAIAREIKARVHAETGLTCSVGVAPNKLEPDDAWGTHLRLGGDGGRCFGHSANNRGVPRHGGTRPFDADGSHGRRLYASVGRKRPGPETGGRETLPARRHSPPISRRRGDSSWNSTS